MRHTLQAQAAGLKKKQRDEAAELQYKMKKLNSMQLEFNMLFYSFNGAQVRMRCNMPQHASVLLLTRV